MRQLLIGHNKSSSSSSNTRALCAMLVKLGNSVSASDLLQLAPQAHNLSAELNLESGIVGLVRRKHVLALVKRNESVLDAAC